MLIGSEYARLFVKQRRKGKAIMRPVLHKRKVRRITLKASGYAHGWRPIALKGYLLPGRYFVGLRAISFNATWHQVKENEMEKPWLVIRLKDNKCIGLTKSRAVAMLIARSDYVKQKKGEEQ